MRNSQVMPWLGEVDQIRDYITITSSTYTVKAADFGKTLVCNSASAQTITVPNFGLGFVLNILRIGAGAVTISAGTGVTLTGNAYPVRYVNTPLYFTAAGTVLSGQSGMLLCKTVTFTEVTQGAVTSTHTGSVTLPPTSWLHSIQVTSKALWAAGTSATMKVGDSADDDGYFIGINVKATDLLVGEVLDTAEQGQWGGKEGAYLVAATGQSGPAATNFGRYYHAGSVISGIVAQVGTTTGAGITLMNVKYSVGEAVAATVA